MPAQSSACRLSSAPPRATASATSRLKLLLRDFFFLFFLYPFFFFFLIFSAAGRFPDSRGSEPAARWFYPAWHRFHFISDEDVELSHKGHKSGQLALAPRRSSGTNFVRASFAHSSTQVRNVTAHSVDGCETRRTQSPVDEIYMAHDASGLPFTGFPTPPAAPGRTRLRAGSELSANLGASTNHRVSAREGLRRERSKPGEAAALGGVACTFHLKADLLQLPASGRIANLILSRDLGAPSGPNSVPLAVAAAALAAAAAAPGPRSTKAQRLPFTSATSNLPTRARFLPTLHVPSTHNLARPIPHSWLSSRKPPLSTPLAPSCDRNGVFQPTIPLPSQRPLQRKPQTSLFRNSFFFGKLKRELWFFWPPRHSKEKDKCPPPKTSFPSSGAQTYPGSLSATH